MKHFETTYERKNVTDRDKWEKTHKILCSFQNQSSYYIVKVSLSCR